MTITETRTRLAFIWPLAMLMLLLLLLLLLLLKPIDLLAELLELRLSFKVSLSQFCKLITHGFMCAF